MKNLDQKLKEHLEMDNNESNQIKDLIIKEQENNNKLN